MTTRTTTNDTALVSLKARLLDPSLATAPTDTHRTLLRLAANEAEALAWVTGYPLLLLPTLLEEKVASLRRYSERQARLRGNFRGNSRQACETLIV